MGRQAFAEGIIFATASGTAVGNTTTETILVPNVTIPANYFQDGRTIRIIAAGQYSTTTGSPTLQFRLRWGGVAGTIIAQTDANAFPNNTTAETWMVEIMVICRSNGATGSLFAMGENNVDGLTHTGSDIFGSAGSLNPAAVTVDLTADTALSFTAQWGAQNPSNTLTCHQFFIESLN